MNFIKHYNYLRDFKNPGILISGPAAGEGVEVVGLSVEYAGVCGTDVGTFTLAFGKLVYAGV